MNLTAQEDENFSRYDRHCEMCALGKPLPDGCPDASRYLSSDFKALFILKEAHGWPEDSKDDYSRDLRRFVYDGGFKVQDLGQPREMVCTCRQNSVVDLPIRPGA